MGNPYFHHWVLGYSSYHHRWIPHTIRFWISIIELMPIWQHGCISWSILFFVTSMSHHIPNNIRWMEEILHQLIGGESHSLKGFNHPLSGAGFLPWTVPLIGGGKCPFLGILDVTFKYLLDVISPIVGWCEQVKILTNRCYLPAIKHGMLENGPYK